MKNFVSGIMVAILFSSNGYTQDIESTQKNERIELVYLSISSENEVIKYKFDSIRDLEENSEGLLAESVLNEEKDKIKNSKISVEISLTISNGVISTIYKDSLTTDYKRIVEEAIKLQDRLVSAVK